MEEHSSPAARKGATKKSAALKKRKLEVKEPKTDDLLLQLASKLHNASDKEKLKTAKKFKYVAKELGVPESWAEYDVEDKATCLWDFGKQFVGGVRAAKGEPLPTEDDESEAGEEENTGKKGLERRLDMFNALKEHLLETASKVAPTGPPIPELPLPRSQTEGIKRALAFLKGKDMDNLRKPLRLSDDESIRMIRDIFLYSQQLHKKDAFVRIFNMFVIFRLINEMLKRNPGGIGGIDSQTWVYDWEDSTTTKRRDTLYNALTDNAYDDPVEVTKDFCKDEVKRGMKSYTILKHFPKFFRFGRNTAIAWGHLRDLEVKQMKGLEGMRRKDEECPNTDYDLD